MGEPQAPTFPEGTPQDVKDFFDCKGLKLEWKPGKVTWLGLPVDPDVQFQHGGAAGTVNLKITIGIPPLAGVSFTLPASVNAAGELTVDTSSIPDLSFIDKSLPGKQGVDDAIKNINDWFKKNGYKLKPVVFKKGVVTLEKTAIAAAPAAPPAVVPGAGGGVTEPVKPAPAQPPPSTTQEAKKESGGWCSLLGMLMILLFAGVIALGGGIGLMFLGGQPPAPTPTAVALASAPTTPSPTLERTPTPTPTPTATPTPAATATPTPSPTAPSPPPTEATAPITQVCVRVVHERLGTFFSYLDWFLWWADEDVDYFEIVVRGANNGESERLVFVPSLGYFHGQLGLMQPGEKQIVSLIAHLTDGSTLDMTQELIDEFGGEEFTVRFPQEDTFGDCPD